MVNKYLKKFKYDESIFRKMMPYQIANNVAKNEYINSINIPHCFAKPVLFAADFVYWQQLLLLLSNVANEPVEEKNFV